MPSKPRILIAGAGIGGLTAALSLARRGFDSELCREVTRTVLGELSDP